MPDLSPANERELRRLLVSLRANSQRLGLYLAVCDDRNTEAALIERYGAAVRDGGGDRV